MNLQTILAINALLLERTKLAGINRAGAKSSPPAAVQAVGMFEHIGLKNLPLYFSTVHRLLKPAGLFLNHGITHDVEGWKKTLSTEFINRYVFPDGQLDTVSNIQRIMERNRFEIADVEALRPHYAMTLRHWSRASSAIMRRQYSTSAKRLTGSGACTWPLALSSSSLAKSACTRFLPASGPRVAWRRHIYP